MNRQALAHVLEQKPVALCALVERATGRDSLECHEARVDERLDHVGQRLGERRPAKDAHAAERGLLVGYADPVHAMDAERLLHEGRRLLRDNSADELRQTAFDLREDRSEEAIPVLLLDRPSATHDVEAQYRGRAGQGAGFDPESASDRHPFPIRGRPSNQDDAIGRQAQEELLDDVEDRAFVRTRDERPDRESQQLILARTTECALFDLLAPEHLTRGPQMYGMRQEAVTSPDRRAASQPG